MRIKSFILLVILSVIMLTSCVSRKSLTYLKYSDKEDSGDVPDERGTSITPAAYKVRPYDNLYIRVLTPDPQWSELFNVDVGMGGLSQESASLAGYSVDQAGMIEIPYVGKVEVAGKTLSEIKTTLDLIFKDYVSDASITLKLVNNYVSVIGEVNSPGRFILTKDRINIFEALSMAADLSEFGNRQKIQLIRPSDYGPVIKEFTLDNRSILASEYYYIMPNDVLYVMPVQGRAFQLNSSIYTLFLTSISTALVIISYFRTL